MDKKAFEFEKALLRKLAARDITIFNQFIRLYSGELCILAYGLLRNAHLAIKAVDDMFERLWREGQFELVDPPIYLFLYDELRKTLKNDPHSFNPSEN